MLFFIADILVQKSDSISADLLLSIPNVKYCLILDQLNLYQDSDITQSEDIST